MFKRNENKQTRPTELSNLCPQQPTNLILLDTIYYLRWIFPLFTQHPRRKQKPCRFLSTPTSWCFRTPPKKTCSRSYLTHQLALHGLTITILDTPKNLTTLTPLLSAHPRTSIETLALPFPPYPQIPPGVENVKDLGRRGSLPVIQALANFSEPVVQVPH